MRLLREEERDFGWQLPELIRDRTISVDYASLSRHIRNIDDSLKEAKTAELNRYLALVAKASASLERIKSLAGKKPYYKPFFNLADEIYSAGLIDCEGPPEVKTDCSSTREVVLARKVYKK